LLIDALDTDLEYVREHTRLLTRAIEWDKKYQKNSGELCDQELLVAEAWLAVSGLKEPPATDLQRDYITYSRQEFDNQRTEMEKTVRISTSRALLPLLMGNKAAVLPNRCQSKAGVGANCNDY
jgi:hypothetical protein